MKEETLSLAEARALAVYAQGLDRRPAEPPTRDMVLATIRRLGCLQIDTISVVARSPYFVLWSRLGAYEPRWLDELHYPEGALFEYWAHAACFVPIEHYRLFRPRMLEYAASEGHPWLRAADETRGPVLEAIRERGPLGSADFEAPAGHVGGGWWNLKPAKHALDVLWTTGELMIQRRVNFQRRYELRERVLPGWSDDQLPTEQERRRELSLIALRAMGLATARQLPDYFRLRSQGTVGLLKSLVRDGLARPVRVEGWDEPAYVHRDHWPALEQGAPAPQLTTLLSPFDSLIWDRDRTRALFGYDYTIECYTPAARRRYGYFVLTILHRGELVGRLDAKAERKAGIFRVKALYLEPGVAPSPELGAAISSTLQECAAWHKTPEVVVERVEPGSFREMI